MITVKELAEKCNVSEQTIRNYCNKKQIQKTKSKRGKPTFIIDFDLEKEIIKELFDSEKQNQNTKTKKQNQNELLFDNHVESLNRHIETLAKQLEIKNRQFEELQLQLKMEQEHSQSLAETIQNLTEQLSISQQLNAGTTKALLTEQEQHKSDVEILSEEKSKVETPKNNVPVQTQDEQHEEVKTKVAEPEPVKAEQEPTEQEEQPQKKQGFFAWLFKRK